MLENAESQVVRMWWPCPENSIWKTIFKLRRLITGEQWPEQPEVALLSMISRSSKRIKKGLFQLFILASQTFIPSYWKISIVPSIREWVTKFKPPYENGGATCYG